MIFFVFNLYMSEINLINDVRNLNDFKKISFSGYEKKKVIKKLLESLVSNKLEEACNWTVELICSGHYKDLWEVIILYMSKYIHIGSPKLPIYINLRINDFKNIVKNGFANYELDLRNNTNIRNLFGEIILILCHSKKKYSFDLIKINIETAFSMENIQIKLKAPNIKYVDYVFKTDDPKELFLSINELSYHLSKDDSYNAAYWVEWIIEFDNICKKKKQSCICERRIWAKVDWKYQKDSIWLVWDLINYYASKKDAITQKIINALLEIFCLRFTIGIKKKRKHLIYNAIYILTEKYDSSESFIHQKDKIEKLMKNIELFYKQVKKNEKSPETDYLFIKTEEKSNIEKTREKLEIMNKINNY